MATFIITKVHFTFNNILIIARVLLW